jgi:hypothetical protein
MDEMNLEAIFIIGILKGLRSQIKDSDVIIALDKSIDVFTKINDGYILQKPSFEEPVQEEAGGEE